MRVCLVKYVGVQLQMERHQTHLLRIYSDTNQLALSKRKLLNSLATLQLPPSPLQEELRTSCTKLYLCISKFVEGLKRALDDFGSDKNQQCIARLANIAQALKNDRELFTQEEAIIAELKAVRERWEQQQDPLVRYQQGERQAVREQLREKLQQLVHWEELGRSTKKPLYVRKLERELRDNLQRVAQTERAFNRNQQERYLSARARLVRLVGRLLGAVGRMNRESLVNSEKNMLLRTYIDRFNEGSRASEKEVEGYRNDYMRTLQNIAEIFKQELHCFSLLLQFMIKVETMATSCYRGVLDAEEEFSVQMRHISQQIFTIVSPKDVIEVVHNCKHFYAFTREWEQAKPRFRKAKQPLEEALAVIKEATQRVARESTKEGKKNGAIEQFIQDKKFMETLVKKESQFEDNLFNIWQSFLQGYLKVLQQTPTSLEGGSHQQLLKRGKSRLQGAFDRLFISYLGETESKSEVSLSLRHSNKAFISQIQALIASISVFSEQVDWSGSYQCSLGPRLLIHGRVKVLPVGLYYQSSFNQKNYFFGRTRLFLPKEQVFQLNKQTVLVFFPDVLQVVTKFGAVYFHALGKRETMYQHFIAAYLPEVNDHNATQDQLEFNEFRGDLALAQQRIQPYLQSLETEVARGVVENIDLRTLFHKYYSNTEFSYQGRTHKDFKHYLCTLAEGSNIRVSGFTPGIPYYLQLASPTAANAPDIEESERLATYDKQIPTIPFVSKGGDGVCQQKVVFRWGGIKCLVIDIFTTVGGFSLTEGMTVKSRQIIREVGKNVETDVSGEVVFTGSSPMNSMIRGPAISNLKDYFAVVMEKMGKLEKNRGQAVGGKKADLREECERQADKIEQLEKEIGTLRKRVKLMSIGFAVIYILTIVFFNLVL